MPFYSMRFAFTIPILFILIYRSSNTYSQSADEYAIKAVWLGRFTDFIEWPSGIEFSNEFILGVLNYDPFQGKLDILYNNRCISGKPVRIKYIDNIDSINNVNMLFLPNKTEVDLDKLITESKIHSILLVGEKRTYAESGVHINFYIFENKVRFEINESAMRDSGFFVSFRLLNIAKIVKPISQQ